MGFESILLWCPPGIRIGVCLGRVRRKTIWTVGWALCPLLICGLYWAFCFPVFLSGLVSLCLWIHSTLSCKQGFAIPTSYIFVLRDTDQTIPLHEYAAHCCQPLLLLCSILGKSLPRSTVSLLLSFTLNQASATTRYSTMPSRRNGNFTWLGFVRGCLIGLALLIRSSVLWFVERINIKLSTEVLRSLSSILWQTPSLVPAYHSHSWDLPSLKQYFAQGPPTLSSSCSRYPLPNIYWVFSMLCTWLYQTTYSILRETKFLRLISLWQKVSGILMKYPSFFCWKQTLSDLWEVATCLSKLLWMMVWFHSHLPFCTTLLKLRVPMVGCG